MNKDIEEVEFTIFDTETTGLDPKSGDRVVEVAAIRFKGKERIGSFQSLINSGYPVSQEAFNVNRISQGMLDSAPKSAEVIVKFADFIKESCLCSYNAGFDLGFLNNELRLLGLSELKDTPVVDILKISRKMLPGLQRYALWFVAEKLGITTKQEHRALSDVELTLGVFYRLQEIMRSKEIKEFSKFLGLFSIDPVILENINNRKVVSIEEAIKFGLSLKIKYLAASSAQVTQREILPKELKNESGRIYLVGYCLLRKEERSFRLDNIIELEIKNANT